MHPINYEEVANRLRHAGVKWSGVNGIDAAGVKQTIKRLIEDATANLATAPNGVTVTAAGGGLLIKTDGIGNVDVYIILGEYDAKA
jgi:hypothetical protein